MGDGQNSTSSRFARFAQRVVDKAERTRSAFVVHATTYGAVNTMLLAINLLTSPGFLWFLFPLGGWGIGLAHHFVHMRNKRRNARDLAALPPLTDPQLSGLRKIFGHRSALAQHITSFTTVSVYLGGINLLTSPGFPWSLFPIAGMSVGLVIHYVSARMRLRWLVERLERLGIVLGAGDGSPLSTAGVRQQQSAAGDPVLIQARELRANILAELEGAPEAERWRKELLPELESYTGHIEELLLLRNDLASAAGRVSESSLTDELAELRGKSNRDISADLRRQYEHAIDQYEQQLGSVRDLRERAEMIDLRTRSAVMSLQQLSIDISRLKTERGADAAPVASLRGKSRELTQYLDDLRAGYRELELEDARPERPQP